ncbi:MAG TPA: hypothetical protein VEG38_15280 [Acidimicrobiia bacterium]|nr:hypothetical protein [Acidimicrobiia bacterium]
MSRKKIAAALVGVGMLAAAAGVAYAAWNSSASGSATAQSKTSVNSAITPGTSLADLYPGAVKTITVTINNPNEYPVIVTSISAGTSDATGTNDACVAGTVTTDARSLDLDGLTQSGSATKIIAAGQTGSYTLDTHMAADAVDACKSQTFTLSGMTATLLSAAA